MNQLDETEKFASDPDPGTVTRAVGRLRRGEGIEQARDEIVAHFWRRIIGLARKRLMLHEVPLRRIGASDVALDTMATLLKKLEMGAYPAANNREDVWKILATVCARQANDAKKQYLAIKRGRGAECGESSAPLDIEGQPVRLEQLAVDASFESDSDCADRLIEILRNLNDEQRHLVQVVAEFGTAEAAKRLDRSQRSVQNDMKILRARIQRLREPDN